MLVTVVEARGMSWGKNGIQKLERSQLEISECLIARFSQQDMKKHFAKKQRRIE